MKDRKCKTVADTILNITDGERYMLEDLFGSKGVRIRIELEHDVSLIDGRLVTPNGGIKGRYVDPDGVEPGTIELLCPSKRWVLTGVRPSEKSVFLKNFLLKILKLRPIRKRETQVYFVHGQIQFQMD